MEQAKSLSALEPFLVLSKSATSPRAAADLIMRATSAPNTYLFTELLQAPRIQALASSPEFLPYLVLLQMFSYGTYASYISTHGLPPLNNAQSLKLRQLSLLTLANGGSLAYDDLMLSLGLQSARELEELVISTVYAGLVRATLDPRSHTVLVNSVAALRDIAPGSVPNLLHSLEAWSARCESTLAELEHQMNAIRDDAGRRTVEQQEREERTARLVRDEMNIGRSISLDAEHGAAAATTRSLSTSQRPGSRPRSDLVRTQRFGKRGSGHMDSANTYEYDDEAMDVDEEDELQDGKKRSSRRKL